METDFLGNGLNAVVYRYWINNHPIDVKCFQNQEDAEKERDIHEAIRRLAF